MANEDIVKMWLNHVHEDISAAEDLYKTGHWLYVGFLCHQAIEKSLKAYYVATHDDDPRYTHSHAQLAVSRTLNSAKCEEILKKTKELIQWIEQRLPGSKPSTPCENTNK